MNKKNKTDLIQEIMKDLNCTKEEAIAVAQIEMNGNFKHYEKSASDRKPYHREKKVDEEKKKIVEILEKALTNAGYSATIVNIDRQIDFDNFTVTVTKHRKREKC